MDVRWGYHMPLTSTSPTCRVTSPPHRARRLNPAEEKSTVAAARTTAVSGMVRLGLSDAGLAPLDLEENLTAAAVRTTVSGTVGLGTSDSPGAGLAARNGTDMSVVSPPAANTGGKPSNTGTGNEVQIYFQGL
ncbi:hypothetical protein B0H19DRAFT_1070565 [Mycena capillaripes]|nr:hypothetical protein B0H19DRAFT_1070565 [Mycena capillaripes]